MPRLAFLPSFRRCLALCACGVWLWACGSEERAAPPAPVPDASADSSSPPDAQADAQADALPDAQVDAASDATSDAGSCAPDAEKECKVVLPSHGGVINCFVGKQYCADGGWGPCEEPRDQ